MNARPFFDPDDTLRLPVRPAGGVSVSRTTMLEDQDGVLLRLEYRAVQAKRRRANLLASSLLAYWGAVGATILWRAL